MSRHREAKESRLSPKLLAGIILALFFGVALCLRICLPYDQIFSGDWIKFGGVDAYYHMRLVDNLAHNFPHLINSDPYLLYPGTVLITRIHFFDWLLAGIIWVVSLGSPTPHITDVIGVYFPAVLGALTIIPVYFIGKEIFNRWAGVIAAGLTALLPGEFMGRSILGFTDHDVAGTLFTTVTLMFLLLAIKTARQRGLAFNHLRHPDRAVINKPLIYSLLAGIFLGIYLITWAGALLFVLAIFVYLVVQFIIDHLRHKSTDYLAVVGVIVFLIALLIFLPASQEMLSSISLLIALIIPLVLSGVSRLLVSRRIKPAYYPLTVVGLGAVGLALFRLIGLFSYQAMATLNAMVDAVGVLFPKGVSLTTIEMQPLLFPGGEFSGAVAWGNFTTGFALSIIALIILIYLIVKQGSAEKSLLVVWSLAILAATLGQRRFAIYFAVNVALLTGYLSALAFFAVRFITAYLRGEPNRYLSRQVLDSPDPEQLLAPPRDETLQRIEQARAKAKKRRRGGLPATAGRINIALAAVIVFFLVFFPNIKPAIATAKEVPFAPTDGWCQSLNWLKDNTPEPFGDPGFYYEFYETPMPEPDYAVLAWWDYGYWITRIAHRVPNTSPAQGGVVEVASFLLSRDEDAATEIVQKLGTKYIIIDDQTAVINSEPVGNRLAIYGKLPSIATWTNKERAKFFDLYYQQEGGGLTAKLFFYPEYYRSLAVRLYNFDGQAVTPQSSLVISYEERVTRDGMPFKEVTGSKSFPSYEEAADYVSSQKTDNCRIVSTSPFHSPVPLEAVKNYRLVYGSESLIMQPEAGMVPEVKVFEYTE